MSLSHTLRHRIMLGTYLKPQQASVLLLALLLFSSIGLQLVNPQVVRTFIDTTQSGGDQQTLWFAAVLFIALALIQRVLALATVYVGENVSWRATNRLRADLARHCLRLDMGFHKQHTPGDLIERIDGDVSALANFFSHFVIRVLGNVLLVLGILAMLFREDWRVGLGLTLYALLTFLALGAVQNLAVARWEVARQTNAEHYGFLEERLSGTEDIRASGAEPYIMQRFYALTRTMLEQERAARLASNLSYLLTNYLTVIGYAFGLGLGAYLYTQGSVTIGGAYLVVYYIGMLAAPLDNIREQAQDLQQATASLNRIDGLFALCPKIQATTHPSTTAPLTLPPGLLPVEFQSVSFHYDEQPVPVLSTEPIATSDTQTAPSVLNEISFSLAPGRVLGLLGRTGSGKTTLTRLLFRLYDPTTGTIRLGPHDVRDLPLPELRQRVGMVTQDVQLFQATIRDNLTFFNHQVSDQALKQLLTTLGLWDWVESLPAGLDTRLGAGGRGLSAGEAQLLAFARVFLKDPGLVILDEASSRLDPASEQRLERAVDRLLQNRTAIIIAHRLQTVQRADDILILESGRIIEYGPREQLACDPNSRFSQLLQTGLEETLA
jgi:ATP-binding cassette subfamily B protein